MTQDAVLREGFRVLQQFRAGGAGGAETPLAAVGLDLFAQGFQLLGLFLAEVFDGLRGTEETERVVDGADVFLQFLQERLRGGLLAVFSDGVKLGLGGAFEFLAARFGRDQGAGGFDEFLFRHGWGLLLWGDMVKCQGFAVS